MSENRLKPAELLQFIQCAKRASQSPHSLPGLTSPDRHLLSSHLSSSLSFTPSESHTYTNSQGSNRRARDQEVEEDWKKGEDGGIGKRQRRRERRPTFLFMSLDYRNSFLNLISVTGALQKATAKRSSINNPIRLRVSLLFFAHVTSVELTS